MDEHQSGPESQRDIRYGHDLREVQDENGIDLLLLQRNLGLSVEDRLKSLEERGRFLLSLRKTRRDP